MAVDVGTALVAAGALSALPATFAAYNAYRANSKISGNGSGTVTEIAERIELKLDDHINDPDAHTLNE